MNWIPVSEQPLPKDGRNILAVVRSQKTAYVIAIIWISWDLSEENGPAWYYDNPSDEYIEVSEEEINLITDWMHVPAPHAWMYYSAPYKG